MSESIHQVLFKPRLAVQVEVLRIEDILSKHYADAVRCHRTNFYHLFILEEGNPVHVVDFESVPLRSRQLFAINKDCVHCFDGQRSCCGYVVIFTDDFFCTTASDQQFIQNTPLFHNPHLYSVIDAPSDFAFFQSSARLIHEMLMREGYAFQQSFLHNVLHNMLIAAHNLYRVQSPMEKDSREGYEMVTLFRELLDQHYRDEKAVSFYCQKLLLSERKLNQSTQRLYGKSPKSMIEDRVLLEAKRLLSHSSLSAKEIGFDLGFEDSAYFFRFFKKAVQQTPLEFRKQYQGAD